MVSTGMQGLDGVLTGLRIGDNVVWQVDEIADYRKFVDPYVEHVLASGKKIVYMRFGDHEALLEAGDNVNLYELDASGGFESFSTEVNSIITKEGVGAHYVFDCLSDLLPVWATDLMVGNFFLVTCPYLFELDTIAYFALRRRSHSYKTVARIRETTQLLIDVFNCSGSYYVHPLKVWNRYSPTMFLPHLMDEGKFTPITDSVESTKDLCYINNPIAEIGSRNLDYWDRLFLNGEDLAGQAGKEEEKQDLVGQYCNIMISRDERILSLAKKNFPLSDLLAIKSRMIGTGVIGGKTVGMLLARKILENNPSFEWNSKLEPHDSFYIGSDVFYSYIVQNGWWKLRMEQKTPEKYFEAACVLKENMLKGNFPEGIKEKFLQIIEYFGQSPIIVRSSSLLEDGFGNAFAGKYESFFCANQGGPEERYSQFVEAVKKIYASTMSEDALSYRRRRGLDHLDEQMALLVQRVSGSYHKKYFFPDVGGVGISYNTYVWNKQMDPEAGMLRLVFGLGTRAVNRVEGDYPRIVAMDKPLLKPYADMSDIKRFSQNKVDVINLEENNCETIDFSSLLDEKIDLNLDQIAIRDEEAMRWMKEKGLKVKDSWILTFDKMVSGGDFSTVMKKILEILKEGYNYPVDIEFTVNFIEDNKFKINIVQCRPLQTHGVGKKVNIPSSVGNEKIFFKSKGYFLGGNIAQPIHRVIRVDSKNYIDLPIREKYDIARIMRKINEEIGSKDRIPSLLLGPGRWGTSTPSLGVPVNFSEINNVAAIVEVAFPEGNLMPDLSFGTHFFQDMVETNIFYVALFPGRKEVLFNQEWLLVHENLFSNIVPEFEKYKEVIGVYDVKNEGLSIMSDILSQEVICFCKK